LATQRSAIGWASTSARRPLPSTVTSSKPRRRSSGMARWASLKSMRLRPARLASQAVAAVHGTTIVGGGDSVAAVARAGVADKMTHISTGGGASLEFLAGRDLPGVVALQSSQKAEGKRQK